MHPCIRNTGGRGSVGIILLPTRWSLFIVTCMLACSWYLARQARLHHYYIGALARQSDAHHVNHQPVLVLTISEQANNKLGNQCQRGTRHVLGYSGRKRQRKNRQRWRNVRVRLLLSLPINCWCCPLYAVAVGDRRFGQPASRCPAPDTRAHTPA